MHPRTGALILLAFLVFAFALNYRSDVGTIRAALTSANDDNIHTEVMLEGCTLRVVTEIRDLPHAQIALARSVLSADLRNYQFHTASYYATDAAARIVFERRDVTADMVRQADRVFEIASRVFEEDYSHVDTTPFLQGDLRFTMQISARVEETEDGQTRLVPGAEAATFGRFFEALAQDPTVTSYQTTASYSEAPPTPEALLMGEFELTHDLSLNLGSSDQIRRFHEAMFNYSFDHDCRY